MFHKLAITLAAVSAAFIALGQPADITVGSQNNFLTIKAGAFDDVHSPEYGRADFSISGPNGTDLVGRLILGFKIDVVPREYLMGGPNTTYELLDVGRDEGGESDHIRITTEFPNPHMKFDFDVWVKDWDSERFHNQGSIHFRMRAQNFTQLWRFVNLYTIVDFDLEGTPENDRYNPTNRWLYEVSDVRGNTETSVNGHWIVAGSASIFPQFQDGTANLNFGTDHGPGDLLFGYRHYVALGPNGDRRGHWSGFGINGHAIPEPATWLALALGSGALLRHRRRRPD